MTAPDRMRPQCPSAARLPGPATSRSETPRHRPCSRFPASISQAQSRALVCAESAHLRWRLLSPFERRKDRYWIGDNSLSHDPLLQRIGEL